MKTLYNPRFIDIAKSRENSANALKIHFNDILYAIALINTHIGSELPKVLFKVLFWALLLAKTLFGTFLGTFKSPYTFIRTLFCPFL